MIKVGNNFILRTRCKLAIVIASILIATLSISTAITHPEIQIFNSYYRRKIK